MPRLTSFFQTEMARTAGSIAPTTRKALEFARQSGEEFSVEKFCQWLIDAGVPGPGPEDDPKAFMKRMSMSVNQRVKKMTADPELGERPSAMKPLVATRKGRTGPGGGGLFRYVYDGPAGVPLKGLTKPKPEDDFDDIPYADDDEAGAEEPTPAPEPAAPTKAKMPPNVLPKADPNGDWVEETMAALADMGYGPDSDIWPQIAKAQVDTDVAKIMGQEGVPPMARPKMIRVAKHIFNRMGRDWETGGTMAPEPAAQGAGDRVYKKGWQGQKKSDVEYEKPPAKSAPEPTPEPDEYEDDGEFLDPDDVEAEPDPVTATQAGAANFVKPSAPAPAAPKAATPAPKPGASVKNIANLMKKFSGKR